MRLVDFLTAIRRRWAVILLCAVVCTGAAGAYSKMTTKIYRAVTTISVTPARFDYGNGLAAQQLLANYAANLTSDTLLRQLDGQMELDIAPDVLRNMITVASDNAVLTITLAVDDTDAKRAADIANGLAQSFITTQTEYNLSHLNPDVDVHVVHGADIPGSPDRPNSKTNILAGLVLGLLVGCGSAYLLDVWDDRLRTEHDIEVGLGLPLLGDLRHDSRRAASRQRPFLDPVISGSTVLRRRD